MVTPQSPPNTPRSAIVAIPSRRLSRHYNVVSTPEEEDNEEFGGRATASNPNRKSTLSWLSNWSTLGNRLSGGSKAITAGDGNPIDDPYTNGNGLTTSEGDLAGGSVSDPERRPLIAQPIDAPPTPRSTSFHVMMNLVNAMMGMGILSLPYALSVSGWVIGCALLFCLAFIASHTAKLLARCMDVDDIDIRVSHSSNSIGSSSTTPTRTRYGSTSVSERRNCKARTYGDVGELAFGSAGRRFITTMFALELFTGATALVIVTSDSLKVLLPHLDSLLVKAIVAAIVCPTTWPRSLRILSYASVIGIITVINLLAILLYDGLSTPSKPGSILDPAETSLWPRSLHHVALSFGLIFVGLDVHAILPSVYRDMKKPHHFPRAVNTTYSFIALVYLTFAACGYLMFGANTNEQITRNLALVPSYSKILTKITVWLVAINPVTKFALFMTPVNTTLENALQISALPTRLTSRTLSTMAVLLVAILFPFFHRVMAILGSAFSFIVVGDDYQNTLAKSRPSWQKLYPKFELCHDVTYWTMLVRISAVIAVLSAVASVHAHQKRQAGCAQQSPIGYNPSDYPPQWSLATTGKSNDAGFRKAYNAIDWSKIPNTAPKGNGTYPASDPDCWWTRGGCTTPKRDGIKPDVTSCIDPNVLGLTYDDGPQCNSDTLLYDFLKQTNQKATLYWIGSNVAAWPKTAQRAVADGHHIAIHTWSHTPLTGLTNEQIVAEFYFTQKIIKEVTGLTVTFWRPPTGDVDDRVRAIAQAMGLQPADIWQVDTNDWTHANDVEANYQKLISDGKSGRFSFGGPVVLAHELDDFTMGLARKYLPQLQQTFKAVVPVATCRNVVKPYVEDIHYPNMAEYTAGNHSPSNGTVATTTTTTAAATSAAPTGTAGPESKNAGAGTSGAGQSVAVGGAAVLGGALMAAAGLLL
ncbi:hypothetical protein HDV00_009435 [Rhizophlyctis rosea]|nr:hypothetical protein HDV00_009435 [Rhizophlyctis rosea]